MPFAAFGDPTVSFIVHGKSNDEVDSFHHLIDSRVPFVFVVESHIMLMIRHVLSTRRVRMCVGTRRKRYLHRRETSSTPSSFGSFDDWISQSSETRSETRREILRRQLKDHGLEIVRPIGRGTFGRVVLAQNEETKKRKQMFAVKIQQISKNELNHDQAVQANEQIAGLKVFCNNLPLGSIVRNHLEKTIVDLEHEVDQADPSKGNLRWFQGKLVRRAVAEGHIMRSLEHPFVCKLHSTFEEMDRLFMVLTFIPGGTLQSVAQRWGGTLSLEQTRFCIAEIVLALAYLRSQKISHRDLKPSNILIDEEGHVQLIDFGLATKFGEDGEERDHNVFCGTAEYVAPEMLLRERWSAEHLDWWALGVMAFELLVGHQPFRGKTSQEVFMSIMMDPLVFPEGFPEEAKTFVGDLLHNDPQKRLQPPKVFAHPFFRDVDWKSVVNKSFPSPLKLNDSGELGGVPGSSASKILLLPE